MMMMIIIIITIVHSNNHVIWKYWATVDRKLSGLFGDPDYRKTTVFELRILGRWSQLPCSGYWLLFQASFLLYHDVSVLICLIF
jgi:hypothetical protein